MTLTIQYLIQVIFLIIRKSVPDKLWLIHLTEWNRVLVPAETRTMGDNKS